MQILLLLLQTHFDVIWLTFFVKLFETIMIAC